MPPTIYLKGSSQIPLPGRTTQIFPNGLVRVEQSFAVKKDSFKYASFIGIQDIDGITYDGLYVFPDPQVTSEENGFNIIKVTAYGRRNNSPIETIGYAKSYFIQRNETTITFLNSEGEITGTETTTKDFKFDSVVSTASTTLIIPEFEFINFFSPSASPEVLALRGLAGNYGPLDVVQWEMTGVNSVNYGHFTEYTANFEARGIRRVISTGTEIL